MRQHAQYLLRPRAVIAVATAAALGLALLTGTGAAAAARRPAAGGSRPAAAGGTWGRAREVTGVNRGGAAGISSVSCGSAGNCSAGGSYDTNAAACDYVGCHFSAFVITQVRGTWGRAGKVPGMTVLNKGRDAGISSVSCTSAGNCSAGGSYTDRSHHRQAFVVSQRRGRWGQAREVPGTAALNKGGNAQIGPVSCTSAGNCSAAGSYTDRSHDARAFVVSQVRGRWGQAREIPGMTAIGMLSCASAGNCTAAGGLLAVSEQHGRWGQPLEIPGLAALAAAGGAALTSLSCGSAGNCAAAGNYVNNEGSQFPFVASQVNGTWRAVTNVPGMTALEKDGQGELYSVSCASAGNCSAGGLFGGNNGYDVGGGGQPIVVTETGGTWGSARAVPGMAALNTGQDGQVGSVSCASPGNCSAAGYYGVGSPGNKVYNLELFVVSQARGTWGKALEIPGTAALNKGEWAGGAVLSCAAPGRCSAAGSYSPSLDQSNLGRAFVVTQN
jgi:hypothetical protein